jgi:hypothetical protein
MKVRTLRLSRRRDGQEHREYCYALLDQRGVCRSLWALEEPSRQAGAVAVEVLDPALLGKRWTGFRWAS